MQIPKGATIAVLDGQKLSLFHNTGDEANPALKAAIDKGLASGVSERDPFELLDELRDGLRAAARSADAA